MKILYILLFTVVVAGCSKSSIVGKWHQDKEFTMEFQENGDYSSIYVFRPDSVITHKAEYTSIDDSVLVISFGGKLGDERYRYAVKDSMLRLIYIKEGAAADAYDTTYYHKSPDYCSYFIEQLFKYGEIRDTSRYEKDFIYFQF